MSVLPAPAITARLQPAAKRFVVALLFGAMLINVWRIAGDWNFGDVNAYWLAAERLRDGEPLYLGSLDPDSYRVFRYAPWFAWIWVPLTYLPRTLVEWGWAAILAASSLWIVVGLLRLRSAAAVALTLVMIPWLLSLVQVGNIQPLVVASLAYGVSRRSGPIWIGLNASLKLVPAFFALVYVARRQWRRVALAAAATAVFAAPYLLYDLSGYQTDPGRSYSLYYYVSPVAWVVAAAASSAVAVMLALRRSRHVWVAAAVAVMLVAPRTHVTYATYLVVGLLGETRDKIDGSTDA
jgi:hypothetical protein